MNAPPSPIPPYPGERFGRFLRRVRRTRDEPQVVLIPILGISQSAVSRVERCQVLPDAAAYAALSKYLGLSVAEIRTWIDREQTEIDLARAQERVVALQTRLNKLS